MWHLLHPAFVHFSVAFLVFGGLAEAFGLLSRRERVATFGGTLVLLGIASLLPTIVSGYVASTTVDLPGGAGDLLESHERNGWFVLGLFFAGTFWKAWYRGELPERHRPFYVLLRIAAVGLAAYSAWLGAEMVYGHGMGVTPA